jgi:hypothetical protein
MAMKLVAAAKVRRALTGMKKGGSTSADCAKLEKELKHHESMSASKAHGMASGGIMKKASGGIIMSKTGKTKMVTAKKGMTNGTTGEVKDGVPGGYKSGGGVKMGNAGGFAKGGNVKKKDDCGCGYESGGNVKDMKSQYPKDFKKGYVHFNTIDSQVEQSLFN